MLASSVLHLLNDLLRTGKSLIALINLIVVSSAQTFGDDIENCEYSLLDVRLFIGIDKILT